MIIVFDSYTISDSTEDFRESAKDLRIGVSRSSQESKRIRAAGITVFGRSNRKTSISFQIQREHTSYAEAQLFVCSHDLDVPEFGRLMITMDDDSSASLEEAVCVQVDSQIIAGVSTITAYAFIGGKLIRQSGGAMGGEGGEGVGGEG